MVREMGERGGGIKKYKLVVAKSHGDAKYSIGNWVAKERICITHGHGPQYGNCLMELAECLVERYKGGKAGTNIIA